MRSAEYNTSGALQRRFVHGAGVDEPLLWYEGSDTSDRRWLMADERGSVVATANASGSLLDINAYDEYGLPDGGNVGRFQYTGQAWIEAASLYSYKARFYAPKHGRFLQTDPIGYGAGLNLYAYVGHDPVNLVDPAGLEEIENITVTASCSGNPLCGASYTRDWYWSLYFAAQGARAYFVQAFQQITGYLGQAQQNQQADPCGAGPSLPPGESYDQNIQTSESFRRAALQQSGVRPPYMGGAGMYSTLRLQFLYEHVRNGGAWDYKQFGSQYIPGGNFNFGAVGASLQFSDQVLLRGAGWAQARAGTSVPTFGSPFGSSPYGDDPVDQQWIKKGIQYYKLCKKGTNDGRRLVKKALALAVLVISVWACERRSDIVEGEIVQRMAHSDGALVAIVARANYGATVPYVYRVYLQSSDSSISAEILRADRLIDIYVEWEDNNTLVIRMRCGRIFKFKNFFYVIGTDGQLLAQVPVKLDTEGLCDSESSF